MRESSPHRSTFVSGQTGLRRREFMASSLAIGFALATRPVTAETIATDSAGLEAGEVKIKAADGDIPGYRAMPASGGPFPTVLVVQEIFGVHEHIRDVCRRFAKLGYFAVAPELYARQGDVSQLTNIDDIRPIVAQVPDAQVMSDLDASVAWAGGTGKADTSRLGITGFCWGGRIVWLYAAHNADLKAGVAWYGRVEGEATALQPDYPVDIAAEIKAPVLGLYGAQDKGIPVESVERMREALKAAEVPTEIQIYPDAGHAFYADYRPSYVKTAADDGWRRLQDWFKRHGVA
jgi:carboxymethylenebutenolidase